MRNLNELDAYRLKNEDVIKSYGWIGDGTCGVFEIPYPKTGVKLFCIASSSLGWDHVSVSLRNRCPNWPEMSFIKRTFFSPDEVVMQLHVAEKNHVNFSETCLHLWRPNDGKIIPLPPKEFIA